MNDNEAPKPLTLEDIEESRIRAAMCAEVTLPKRSFLELLDLAEKGLTK